MPAISQSNTGGPKELAVHAWKDEARDGRELSEYRARRLSHFGEEGKQEVLLKCMLYQKREVATPMASHSIVLVWAKA